MRNLEGAKIIRLIYPTTDVEVPIKPDLKKSPRLHKKTPITALGYEHF